MFTSSLGRLFLSALALFPLLLPAQRRIEFPRVDGSGSEHAIVIPVDDEGLYVTIGVVAADVTKGKSGEHAFTLLAQEPQSRITILKGPKPTDQDQVMEFGSGRTLLPGDQLQHVKAAKAVVVSWESQFHGQYLPLSFMRLHHQGAIPAPGSPMVNSDGKVLAICHQASDTFGRGTYALPAEAVQSMVASVKKHGKIRRSFCGINLDARDPLVSVIGVRPDSPAAKSGLKKDDIILSIAGRSVKDYAQAIDAFFYLVPGNEVEFSVLRGVGTKKLQMTPVIDPRHAAIEQLENPAKK